MYPKNMNPAPYPDASDLFGKKDPPLFEVLNPGGKAPLLLVSDHNSNAIPQSLNNLGLSEPDLNRHIAYDIGADAVVRHLSEELDAVAVLAGYSRLLIDINRAPGDPSAIPEVSDGTAVPGNRDLTEEDKIRRTETFHHPYHHAVSHQLNHLWRSGGKPPALLSVHTFTPTIDGEDRFWHIGVLWNRDPRLAEPLIGLLSRDPDVHVGDNQPYSGRELAYTIDLHAGTAGLPNAAVEIRQDLVETDAGAEEWASRLAVALSVLLPQAALHEVVHF